MNKKLKNIFVIQLLLFNLCIPTFMQGCGRCSMPENEYCPFFEKYRDFKTIKNYVAPAIHSIAIGLGHIVAATGLFGLGLACLGLGVIVTSKHDHEFFVLTKDVAIDSVRLIGIGSLPFIVDIINDYREKREWFDMPQEIVDAADDTDFIPVNKKQFALLEKEARKNAKNWIWKFKKWKGFSPPEPLPAIKKITPYTECTYSRNFIPNQFKWHMPPEIRSLVLAYAGVKSHHELLKEFEITEKDKNNTLFVTEKSVISMLPYLKYVSGFHDIIEICDAPQEKIIINDCGELSNIIHHYNFAVNKLRKGWIRCNKNSGDKTIFYRQKFVRNFYKNRSDFGPRCREIPFSAQPDETQFGNYPTDYLFSKDPYYQNHPLSKELLAIEAKNNPKTLTQ